MCNLDPTDINLAIIIDGDHMTACLLSAWSQNTVMMHVASRLVLDNLN